MIGSQAEANQIARWWAGMMDKLPFGWEFLGHGTCRVTYLSPSGVVYKLQHDEFGQHDANLYEMAAIERGKRSPEARDFMPEAKIFWTEHSPDPVLAMEYLSEPCELTEDEVKPAELAQRISTGTVDLMFDGRERNARRRPDGRPVFIDLGGDGDIDWLLSAA